VRNHGHRRYRRRTPGEDEWKPVEGPPGGAGLVSGKQKRPANLTTLAAIECAALPESALAELMAIYQSVSSLGRPVCASREESNARCANDMGMPEINCNSCRRLPIRKGCTGAPIIEILSVGCCADLDRQSCLCSQTLVFPKAHHQVERLQRRALSSNDGSQQNQRAWHSVQEARGRIHCEITRV
jgi:hypothetical protein